VALESEKICNQRPRCDIAMCHHTIPTLARDAALCIHSKTLDIPNKGMPPAGRGIYPQKQSHIFGGGRDGMNGPVALAFDAMTVK
jgi:hypothetical protein